MKFLKSKFNKAKIDRYHRDLEVYHPSNPIIHAIMRMPGIEAIKVVSRTTQGLKEEIADPDNKELYFKLSIIYLSSEMDEEGNNNETIGIIIDNSISEYHYVNDLLEIIDEESDEITHLPRLNSTDQAILVAFIGANFYHS